MRAVEDWIKMYVHPTGIRLFVARETEKAAQALGDAEVEAWAREVVVADSHTQQLELEWLGKKDTNTKVRERAMEVDNRVDSAVGALHSHFVSLRDRLPTGSPNQMLAKAFIKDVFPKGARPIITLPFEEEHSAIDGIIAKINARYLADVATLGGTIFFNHLVETQAEYGSVLSILNSEPLKFAAVEAARAHGKNLYAGMIIRILAKYLDDESGRQALLKTIEDQEERIAERNKRHRNKNKKANTDGTDTVDDVSDVDEMDDDFEEAFDENYEPISVLSDPMASE